MDQLGHNASVENLSSHYSRTRIAISWGSMPATATCEPAITITASTQTKIDFLSDFRVSWLSHIWHFTCVELEGPTKKQKIAVSTLVLNHKTWGHMKRYVRLQKRQEISILRTVFGRRQLGGVVRVFGKGHLGVSFLHGSICAEGMGCERRRVRWDFRKQGLPVGIHECLER